MAAGPPALITKENFGPEHLYGLMADKDENHPLLFWGEGGIMWGCSGSELVQTAEGPLHLTFNFSKAPWGHEEGQKGFP